MVSLPHKSTQYLPAALKVFILGVTFWFVYSKLVSNDQLSLSEFFQTLARSSSITLWTLLFCFGVAGLNWAAETAKWKALASTLQPINFSTAWKQTLTALTVSLATPNRIGEYGAKAYFFNTTQRKKVLLLTFFSNGMQLCITFLFGLVGLAFVLLRYDLQLSIGKGIFLILVIGIVGIIGYWLKEKQLGIKGLSIAAVIRYFSTLPKRIWVQTTLYAGLRYLLFSSLFLILLWCFDVNASLITLLPLIYAMYLLASIVPSVFLLDVVIKGGVAVWLFSLAGIDAYPVLCTVLAMWLLNFVFPAIVGSYYLLRYKKETQ
ncbi:lysylphosphatidylglycerol synthase domain-containing protein [Candidatus Ulvibacter alkanivorans]|uniref:lysylphosphatidylglycerol synthase domain-containing protein n=1 Tax=Candidatus Ulvibacter alkanivorans TaxID=2267620 RepID=UPI000DF33AB9|nr:lysylphosphatidylglycerol synthase domain-containing protein [Candidatus Ulvibacter alkanivorans]